MSIRAVVLVALAAASIAAARDAGTWMSRLHGTSSAVTTAVDPAGNVFAAIPLRAGKYSSTTAILLLGSKTGRERWRYSLKVPGPEHSDFVHALRVASDGDPVAAAGIEIAGAVAFVVLRLDGRSGRERWRRVIHGAQRAPSYEEALAAALDSHGDVVAAGFLESTLEIQYHGTSDFAVVKLDGETGAERWRFVVDGTAHEYDQASEVSVDGAGDVVAAGTITDSAPTLLGYRDVPAVVKLSGSDGHLLWRSNLDAVDIRGMALDASGNVLVAGTFSSPSSANDFGVAKIDGTTGTLDWARTISLSTDKWETAFAVTALPSGEVAGVGFTGDIDHDAVATIAVWDGATGAERWRRTMSGTQQFGIARAVANDPRGQLVVGGRFRNQGSCYDVAVTWLSAVSGDVLASRMIDGRTQATTCDRTDCRGDAPGGCPPSRAGADQDDLSALSLDPSGDAIVAGALSDGKFGRQHGFVARLRSP